MPNEFKGGKLVPPDNLKTCKDLQNITRKSSGRGMYERLGRPTLGHTASTRVQYQGSRPRHDRNPRLFTPKLSLALLTPHHLPSKPNWANRRSGE